MDEQSVCYFGSDCSHLCPDCSDEYRWGCENVAARTECGRHERVLIEVAAKVQRLVVVPAVPDCVHRGDELTHPSSGTAPRHAEPAFDVRLDLGTQPEHEFARTERLQVVGDCRHAHRVACERYRDGRSN